jgi:hypothetical protein
LRQGPASTRAGADLLRVVVEPQQAHLDVLEHARKLPLGPEVPRVDPRRGHDTGQVLVLPRKGHHRLQVGQQDAILKDEVGPAGPVQARHHSIQLLLYLVAQALHIRVADAAGSLSCL